MSKQNKAKFVIPQMSWERPIEQAILEFCENMARQMEWVANKPSNGLFGSSFMDTDKDIREGARHYAHAYRTVGNQVKREIAIRKRKND